MRRFGNNKVEASENEIELRRRSSSFREDGGNYLRSRSYNNDSILDEDEEYARTLHTVRRTRSLHRNAHQNAINFLPSRHVTNMGALGSRPPGPEMPFLNQGGEGDHEIQVEQIVQQMEQDENLMEDSPDAEQLRIDALRDLPQCLTVKRNIRAKITASVSRKSKHRPIGFFKRTKYRFSFWKKKIKQNFRNMIFSFELWYESIKVVQGQYGSGVATYFLFLRWLFIMNAFTTIIVISFLVVPQILAFGPSSWIPFNFQDIFTGQGSFTQTILYYGYYSGAILDPIPGLYYNMSYAYVFTMFVLYIGIFIILSVKIAKSYRKSFIETEGGFKNVYANKIFCGWEFGIATQQAAALKSRSIHKELKELLSESTKVKEEETCSTRCNNIMINIFVHGLALGLLSAATALMIVIINVPDVRGSGNGVLMAFIVSFIMVVLPPVFSFMAMFECYKDPRTKIFITLLRTFTLEVVITITLTVYWLTSKLPCWETSLGQEIYRLIIFDFILAMLLLPILVWLRSFMSRRFWEKLGVPEFDIAQNTLGLIYNQTLLWMGLFFSPLLGLIVSLKMFILFYIKYLGIHYSYKPSDKSWRASQTNTFFLLLIFFSLLGIILTFGFMIMKVELGKCGPFGSSTHLYKVIFEEILSLEEKSDFLKFLIFFTKPGVIGLVLIAMCVAVYYLRSKAMAQKEMVSILRQMLVLQSKDKEFLLNAIANVSQGRWIYSEKQGPNNASSLERNDSSLIGNSSTWKFVKDAENIRTPSNANYKFNVATPNKYDSPRASVIRSPVSPSPSSSGVVRRNYENFELVNSSSPTSGKY